MTVSATTETRKQYTGNAGYTTSTDFTAAFKYLDTSEIKVTHTNASTSADTAYVEGTHYSVQSGAAATSVTIRFLTSYVPTAATEYITIHRETAFSQLTDYTEGSALDAETLEQNFDKAIMLIQQVNNNLTDLNISFSGTNDFNSTAAAASEIITSKALRANKALGFDVNGDIEATQDIGTFRGNWAASSAYIVSDLVKDASNNNIYICNTAHSSTGSTPVSTNTDVAKWTLIVDAASTTTSTTTASEWASKTSGIVASTDYSAKAYAIGGTGVTTSSGKGAAKEWATTTGGAVDTSEYSAKEYSVGTTATSSKSYALKVDGAVTGTDFSSKAWAVGGTNVTTTSSRGAAKEWATSTGAAVDTSEYSAKEYAIGGETASGGSAKAWAIDGSSPDGTSEKSAKTLAGEAVTSAGTATTQAGLASDHREDAGKYAVTAEDSTFSLTSTNGGTSGLYSAKHYQAKAQANQTAAASSASAAASSAASAMDTGKAIAFSLIFGA